MVDGATSKLIAGKKLHSKIITLNLSMFGLDNVRVLSLARRVTSHDRVTGSKTLPFVHNKAD